MTDQPDHEHVYAPNGLVRESATSWSPVTAGDNTLYDKVFSIGLCPCGKVSKTHVANENVRTQADEWRKERR